MGNVKFKVKTLDKDTRHEYPVSDAFVEVSEAFEQRLLAHDPKGEMFEIEGHKYKADKLVKPKEDSNDDDSSDLDIDALREEYTKRTGNKAGRLGAVKLQEAIGAHKLANPESNDDSSDDEDDNQEDNNEENQDNETPE